jgi:hypothetical protein
MPQSNPANIYLIGGEQGGGETRVKPPPVNVFLLFLHMQGFNKAGKHSIVPGTTPGCAAEIIETFGYCDRIGDYESGRRSVTKARKTGAW